MKDTLYRSVSEPIKPFEFDQKVVDVFPDMIKRSVPGYPLTIAMLSVIADQFVQERSNVYDLGCSLGAAGFAIQQGLSHQRCHIIGVDNSSAMIDACHTNSFSSTADIKIDFICQDIQETVILNASVVIMNFTLQFVSLPQRLGLIKKIYNGLLPGGVFILSEKLAFADVQETMMMTELHHQMKTMNGYDALEIASKRQALDEVLIPETVDDHQSRLEQAGFDTSFVWLRCFNFASMLAVK